MSHHEEVCRLLINRARSFALEAHKGQRYGKLPYEFHLRAVVEAIGPDAPPAVQAAGWLHDVVEDTSVTIGDVREEFGGTIARMVDCCTDGDGETRAERKQAVYKKLRLAPASARRVKLADRLANMKASSENPKMGAKYCAEFPEFMRVCGTGNENNDLVVQLLWVYLDTMEALGA